MLDGRDASVDGTRQVEVQLLTNEDQMSTYQNVLTFSSQVSDLDARVHSSSDVDAELLGFDTATKLLIRLSM